MTMQCECGKTGCSECGHCECLSTKWISVKERLPQKNEWVLAFFVTDVNKKCSPISVGKIDDDGFWEANPYWCCCGGLGWNVSHWMPLPTPPSK